MAHDLQADQLVILMHPRDTVATALELLAPGALVQVGGQTVRVQEPIPFGHKVAIRPMAEGELVYKYGEVIGRATALIEPGQHVHVQNVEGTRGRGDLAKEGAGA